MANPYVKQTWTDGSGGGTPVSAARLGVAEQGIFDAHYPYAVSAYHNANQSITTATWTALALNSERFDQVSNAASTMHDTVTNNSRLTALVGGIYLIVGNIEWAANATGDYRMARILMNGATELAKAQGIPDATGNAYVHVSRLYSMAANDYVQLQAFQDSGAGLNVLVSANYSPEFSMCRIA